MEMTIRAIASDACILVAAAIVALQHPAGKWRWYAFASLFDWRRRELNRIGGIATGTGARAACSHILRAPIQGFEEFSWQLQRM
jgi:hypothetical protein